MKKTVSILIFIFIVLLILPRYNANALDISAHSAILIDGFSGRVLYEKNANKKLPMASTTKIMTGILALEYGNFDDIIVTSPKAAHVEGSSIWLEEGEKQRLEDLVYGLLLSSGNDAAIAIAEHIGGSTEEFAEMMTAKAREIGVINTSFKNPNGLDEKGHYTTAYDLAQITRYGMQNEKFAQIVKTKTKKIPWEGHKWKRSLKNHNKLLNIYEGCDGVKTGFTKKSGRCLVSSATKNGWQVIAVTLNAPNDWEDHKKILDYAFNNYKVEKVVEEGEYMKTLPVIDGKSDTITLVTSKDFSMALKGEEKGKITFKYDVPDVVSAPVSYLQTIGSIKVCLNDMEYEKIDLVSIDSVEKEDVLISFKKIVKNWIIIFNEKNFIFPIK